MIAALKPYPEMKDSGVPWLGDVPEHWEVKRNKLFLREINERSKDGSEELLTVSQYTGITRRRERLSNEADLLTNAASLVGYKRVQPGDLVMNIMLAWNGSLGVSAIKGIASPAYCIFRARNGVEPRFLHYLLRTPLFTGAFKTVSTGVVDSRLRLYPDVFFRLPSLLPPLPEQSAIVRFLDHMDRRIGRAIRAKQKLIALLNEQKQAIIHQAVSRGLDPNVHLKPSGVVWLGDVPEHWEVCRLRNVVSRVTSGSRGWSDCAADEGPLFLRVGNLTRDSIELRLDDVVHLDLPDTAEVYRTRVQAGDVLVSITAYIGSVAVVPPGFPEAYVSQHIALCRPRDEQHDSRWLAYVLLSPIGQGHGQVSLYGGTKDGLSLDDVKDYPILLPPRLEQSKIVGHLDTMLAKISRSQEAINREIALLREYRTRLIADLVTGKLDVRAAAAQLPEEPETPEPLDEADALVDGDEETGATDLDAALEEATA